MVAFRKRKWGVAGSIISIINAACLLFWDLLLVADNIAKKLTEKGFINELLANFNLRPSEHYFETQPKYDYFSFFYALMFLVGVVIIILAIQYMKDPCKIKGKVCYRQGNQWISILIQVALAVVVFLGSDDVNSLTSYALFEIICYVMMGIAGLAVFHYIASLLSKKNVFVAKEKIQDQKKQSVDVDTMYSAEKATRINQLKALGGINSKQYDDSVSKFSRGA